MAHGFLYFFELELNVFKWIFFRDAVCILYQYGDFFM